MKAIKKTLIMMVLALAVFCTMTITAHADVSFNSTNYIALKKNKKKSAKLKGLTKQQKKKNWKFSSSDTSVAKVKRSGKYGYKITAAKKKDGYAVIRAAFPGGTETYLLVKVGTGKNINSKTRTWATNIRSSYKAGSAAYRAWTLPGMSTGNGSNGSNTGSGSSSGSTGNTGTSTSTSTTTDWYATHPQYTNVAAAYGARDNKMVPIASTTVVGTDKNGYGYDSNGNIGTDRDGKKLKAIIDPITFSLEVVPYMDTYYRSFDNGYFNGNGGPNYVGKNVIFTKGVGYTHAMPALIKIKTSGSLDTQALKNLHGASVSQSFIDGNWKGQSTAMGSNYTQFAEVIGENPTIINYGLTSRKINGGYLAVIGSDEKYGTYRYSVTIDGVTKSVDIKIVDHRTEWQNWYIHKYDTLSQAEVTSRMNTARTGGIAVTDNWPDIVLETCVRIGMMNQLLPEVLVYKKNGNISDDNYVLSGIPSFIATKTMPAANLKMPGCTVGVHYGNDAALKIQQTHNVSPGYWGTIEAAGQGHLLYYNALYYNGKDIEYPHIRS